MSRYGQAHDDAVRPRSLSDLRDGRRGRLPAALRDGATLGEPRHAKDDPQAGRPSNRRLRTADRAFFHVRAMISRATLAAPVRAAGARSETRALAVARARPALS